MGYDYDDDEVGIDYCPACGQPVDYCQGHGESGDPEGFEVIAKHDNGDHEGCHPDGCEVAKDAEEIRSWRLNDVWTTPSGLKVPCAVVEHSAIPGYYVVLVDDYDGVEGRRKVAVPGNKVARP